MNPVERLKDFEEQLDKLEQRFEAGGNLGEEFKKSIDDLGESIAKTKKDVEDLNRSMSGGMRNAIDGLIFQGENLSDAVRHIGSSVAKTAYDNAVTPVAKHLGGALSQGLMGLIGALVPFANGGSFSQGRVQPFANGGVVTGPTTFPMRGGTGLMGEAGPEAIMPLTRGADGRLGVQAAGGSKAPINVVMNIQTPDAQGFRRSQSQIAAQLGRVLGHAQRNR